MKNILITGANGQLGHEMRRVLGSSEYQVYYTDVAELNITDKAAVSDFVSTHAINIIVNCAAYTAVDQAEDDQELADKINHLAVDNLAQAAKMNNAVLIHVSTDYVFGGMRNTPIQEDMPTNPLGVYGATKLAGEGAIKTSGCTHFIIRTAWLYSAFGKNFVKTMFNLTRDREELAVVFDQVGSPTHAGDLADFIYAVITTGDYEAKSGVYHFSNEGVCSWFDFTVAINQLAGHTCHVKPCHSDEFPAKVTRPSYSVLDKSKLKANYDYKVPYWTESLQQLITQLKEQ